MYISILNIYNIKIYRVGLLWERKYLLLVQQDSQVVI